MKAWALKTPAPVESNPLELVELPTPVPQDDELLVRVSVCGICRTDLHVVEGELSVRRPHIRSSVALRQWAIVSASSTWANAWVSPGSIGLAACAGSASQVEKISATIRNLQAGQSMVATPNTPWRRPRLRIRCPRALTTLRRRRFFAPESLVIAPCD